MTCRRFDLTDFEWRIIQPLLPNKSRGVPRVDDRRVINGILWRFRTGSPWADVPERYGPYTTCFCGVFRSAIQPSNRTRSSGDSKSLLSVSIDPDSHICQAKGIHPLVPQHSR
jgi:transposase